MKAPAGLVLPTTGKSDFAKTFQRLIAKAPDLPFPIRPQVEKCLAAIESQDSVAAVWFLKDATEATVRLLFVVTSAEVLRLVPERGSDWLTEGAEALPKPLRELSHFVRYNPTPSLGALLWRLDKVAVPNASVAGHGSVTVRLAPLWKAVSRPLMDLKDWRNAYHGHGALGSHSRAADELRANIAALDVVVEGLRPLWGALHVTQSSLLAATSIPTGNPSPASSGNPAVSFRPLVELLDVPGSAKEAWLLDAADLRKGRLKYRSASSMEPRAVSRTAIQSAEIQAVERLAEESESRGHPIDTGAEEGDLELGWLTHIENLRFAGYDRKRYTEPTYLVNRIEDVLKAALGGALRITGPGGTGKSFLVRGLTGRWRTKKNRYTVLPYYAIPGQGVDIASFVVAIYGAVLEESRRLANQGARGLSLPNEGRQPGCDEFPAWLCTLVRHNRHIERFILIADGLDELRSGWSDSSIVDLLPREIPERLFLLLSSRSDQDLHPGVLNSLKNLQWIPGSPVLIEPNSGENKKTLLEHLGKYFPEIDKDGRGAIVDRAEGRFLHVEMLGRGLREGAFDLSPEKALPQPSEIVTRYLDWLSGSVRGMPVYGRALKETVAFLAVAVMPVPLECLIDWGIDPRWVEEIVIDLQGLLAREKSTERSLVAGVAEPYVYRLYHRDLIDDLRQDAAWVPQIDEAKKAILESIIEKRVGRWDDEDAVSWTDPGDAYAMLALGKHIAASTDRVPVPDSDIMAIAARLISRAQHLEQTYLHPKGALECLDAAEKLTRLIASAPADAARERELGGLSAGISAGRSGCLRSLMQLQQALREARHAESVSGQLLARFGETPQALQDLWGSLNRVADVLLLEGDRLAALAKYEEGEAISRLLLARFGETPRSLSDLWVSLTRVADVKLVEGDRLAALAKYEEGEVISRQLLARFGETPKALRDLWASLIKIADVLLAEGDRPTALAKYREGEAISRQLLARYGETPGVLRDLSISTTKVAGVILAGGQRLAALVKYREAEVIRRQLLAQFGETPGALRDLSVSTTRVADVLLVEGDRQAALAKYEEGEAISRRLLTQFGETPLVLRDLWVSLTKIADVLLAAEDGATALARYEEGEVISRQLLARFGDTPGAQRDLAISLWRVADALLKKGERDVAVAKLTEAVHLASKYVQKSRDSSDAMGLLATLIKKLDDEEEDGNHEN